MQERRHKLDAAERRLRYAARKALPWALAAAVVAAFIFADRLGAFGAAPPPDPRRYDARTFTVVHVVDGDTLDIDVADQVRRKKTTRIRLWGVDTPESVKPDTPVQHFAPEASQFAKTVALGKRVKLELVHDRTRGKYKRLLAYVYLPDGRMLNRRLIAEGYGYADPRYDHPRKTEFQRLQKQALRNRAGLWKDVRRRDLPYYYRTMDLPER